MLHVLTHPFPTRRSSDLAVRHCYGARRRPMRPPVGQPFFLEDPPGVETAMVSKPAGATEDLVFTALGFRISRLLRVCALAIINSCEYWIVIRDHDMLGAGDRKSTRLNSSH